MSRLLLLDDLDAYLSVDRGRHCHGEGRMRWRGILRTVPEELVPDPGSMLLLGSGVGRLAAYSTLRLRSGQALR